MQREFRRIRLGLIATCSAMALLPHAAFAADEPAASTDADEIIVTAQKREQRLQDVPISVAVVTGEKLLDSGVRGLEDMSSQVPSLTISKTPGAYQIVLRGIGSGTGSTTLDQSVVLFVDGIYGGNARQFSEPFLDVERVEVLRGPQGALVGKNTSAGAINIISKRPGDTLEGYVNAEYDFTLNSPKFEGAVTIPLGGGLSARAVAKFVDSDGWIYNSLSRAKEPHRLEKAGRLTLGYEAGPFQAYLKGEVSSVKTDGLPIVVVSKIANRPRDLTKESGSIFGPEYDKVDAHSAVLNMTYDFGPVTLASISGYSAYKSDQREDADFFEKDLSYSTFQEDYKQYSQELRLLSPAGGTFEWALGAYYHKTDLVEERTTQVLTVANANTYRRFAQNGEVLSFYGQTTLRALPELWVVGSLRYTHETKDAHYAQYGGSNVLAVGGAGATLQRTIIQDLSENHTDPAVSVQFRPSRNFMLYGSYLHGSKSGGFQGAISGALANSFQFAPESSKSFEAGAKFSMPGRGYINLAVFDTTYSNLQLSVALQTTSVTSFTFFTGNAGEARVRGFEMEGSYRFSDAFSVDASLAWTPTAKYSRYVAGPCYPGRTPTNTVSNSCDLSGQRLAFVPEVSFNVSPRITVPVADGLKLTASSTVMYQGRKFTDVTGDPLSVQTAFAKVDARIAIGSDDDRWELALLGRNLTNRITQSFGAAAQLAANAALGIGADARLATVEPPRTITVQARYRF